jgi:hypothetical protein
MLVTIHIYLLFAERVAGYPILGLQRVGLEVAFNRKRQRTHSAPTGCTCRSISDAFPARLSHSKS